MKVICVIPAFNESQKIAKVISELSSLVDEVIVVDDCSTDDTFNIAKEHCLTIKHIVNRGQGAALRSGTHLAFDRGADIVIHFDADGQFLAKDIKTVIDPLLKNEADMTLGSRFIDNSTKMPFIKKQIVMRLARCFNMILGINLTDPQSGFRAFTKKAAVNLNWQQDRMAHCSEILFLAHKNNLRIKEVPITVIYHEYGQKLSGGFKIIFDLLLNKLSS